MTNEKETAKQAAKEKRAPVGPRPGYLVLAGERAKEVADMFANGEITILDASRKAEDVLKAVSSGKAGGYVRFEIK